MSKEKVIQNAVHQAVLRAANALKEKDSAFSRDLDEHFIISRSDIHPRQLSVDGELFPTFPHEGKV